MEYIYKVMPWCYNNLKERDRIRNRGCLRGGFKNKKWLEDTRLKKQFCKTMSYVMTAALFLGVSMPSSPAAAKKKASTAPKVDFFIMGKAPFLPVKIPTIRFICWRGLPRWHPLCSYYTRPWAGIQHKNCKIWKFVCYQATALAL